MAAEFETDPYPARPKILFVGNAVSSHTHSWIDLLAGEPFNLRLFSVPPGEPPADWPVKCYLAAASIRQPESATRRRVFPAPENSIAYGAYLLREAFDEAPARHGAPARGRLNLGAALLAKGVQTIYAPKYPASLDRALARVIRAWRPDIIHTLGFDAASYLYSRARKLAGVAGIGRWVAQARGGPDISLQRHSPETLPLILEVFRACDHFIADNRQNYDYAVSAGLSPKKIAEPGMGVVSGPGGIDVDGLRTRAGPPPSQRQRLIVWPKAYETYTAKAMPVFEAILAVWERIRPCRIEMLWMTQPEVRLWYEKLFPAEIKACCGIHARLPHAAALAHIAKARVMLAPSLSDGIPNTMMEAMALGAAPIISPLDTIAPMVESERNVFFARNLYVGEIAEAILRAMTDDRLVDAMAANNLAWVRHFADRADVRRRALAFYEAVARLAASR